MFVLTIDQKASRQSEDRVPWLLHQFQRFPTLTPFQRSAGDEVQGVLDDPQSVVEVLVLLMHDRGWHCGLGIGPGSFLNQSVPVAAEGTGEAFYIARDAVEQSKKQKQAIVLNASAESLNVLLARTLLHTLQIIYNARTPRQQEVIAAYKNFGRMDMVAQELGVSASAISQSLAASHYDFEQQVLQQLEELLTQIHRDVLENETGERK